MGELIPYWFRLGNIHTHIHNKQLAGEMSVLSILGTMRYVIRTMLHYPQIWECALDCIQQGIYQSGFSLIVSSGNIAA